MNADPQEPIFLDTNVLVYAFDRTAGRKREQALQFVTGCWENENGCLSLQVLQEFYVTVTRKIANPLQPPTARQIVAELAQWRLHAPEAEDLLQAIDLGQRWQLSFWDAQIVQSATSLGCQVLYTEDLSHGQLYGQVRVVNPFLE
jgi:predicted nucleic acid-binding protein